MVNNKQISTSKTIQQRTGKTFHLATRLLPERVRHATYVLYAFFRMADDVVDTTADRDPAVQHEELAEIREAALGERETDDEVLSAFRELVVRYDIADEDIDTFVDAMQSDLENSRYGTRRELETYMRGSAVAVGNMMMAVMEVEEREVAAPYAAALAEAFQLTNFLRDVGEDVEQYDRVYLPRDTREEYGVTVDQLREQRVTQGFRQAMRSELAYAEAKYREGVAGIAYLPDDCQFAVLLSAVLYADHHRLVRARDFDVLTHPPEPSLTRKLGLLAKTRLLWTIHRDPEYVFYWVTGLGQTPDRQHHHADPNPVS